MEFLHCLVYLAVSGVSMFFVGRILPKNWFCDDKFPFKCFEFERGGKIYEKLGIKSWQDKVPDMSKILPKAMPAKSLENHSCEQLKIMIRETRVAEFVHLVLCLLGLYCRKIWKGKGGAILTFIYVVICNLPFIVIQRYNRPRLERLLARKQEKKLKKVS